jgi:hypothetical protein
VFGASCSLESRDTLRLSGTTQIDFCAAQNFPGFILRRINSDAPAALGIPMLL